MGTNRINSYLPTVRKVIFLVLGGVSILATNHVVPKSVFASLTHDRSSFGYDVKLLRKFDNNLVVLSSGKSRVAISPKLQGRVMTSSFNGEQDMSLGWINETLLKSGSFTPHISPFGGEDRFWLGPEGGQFSLYFKKGASFIFDNWNVPKALDSEPFELVNQTKDVVSFERKFHLENYKGTQFNIRVRRDIKILPFSDLVQILGNSLPKNSQIVGFESSNMITNLSKIRWIQQNGLLSIWILSMLKANDKTTILIPYKLDHKIKLGKIVTDDYFGEVPQNRLVIHPKGMISFKADAKHRSKIGIPASRTIPILFSYDAQKSILTIVQFSFNRKSVLYVNSLWKEQPDPFSGDVVNAYNDGPLNGNQLGQFYELESSSKAAELAPNTSIRHTHRTIHIRANIQTLNHIVSKLLGSTIDLKNFQL